MVKSHLIPKALTRFAFPDRVHTEGGAGRRAKRVWNSWYDASIVTTKGEKILGDYDDWAVKFFREEELVWSGWGGGDRLSVDHIVEPVSLCGARTVKMAEPARLRLFFLSLLWRAAVSNLDGFREIILPPEHLERLRIMVLSGDPSPTWFCPIQLVQIYTRGEVHNVTPFMRPKIYLGVDGAPDLEINCYRFYFDGLIAHIHANFENDDGLRQNLELSM
jgi:hypothetical protein